MKIIQTTYKEQKENFDIDLCLKAMSKLDRNISAPFIKGTIDREQIICNTFKKSWIFINKYNIQTGTDRNHPNQFFIEKVLKEKKVPEYVIEEKANEIPESKIRSHFLSFSRKNKSKNKIIFNSFYGQKFTDEQKIHAWRMESLLGVRPSKCCSTLAIDIDSRNNPNINNTIINIIKTFNYKKPICIEKSVENGGWHIYYKFKKHIDYDLLKKFENWFNTNYNATIEVLTSKKMLRLPSSYTYTTGEIINLIDIQAGYANHIELKPHKTCNEFFSSIMNYKKTIPNSLLEKTVLYKPKEESENSLPPIFLRRYENEEESKAVYIKRPLHRGNRIKNHITLGFYAIHKRMTLEEFIKLSLENDEGSKDMLKNPYKTCEKIYNWCKIKYNNTSKSSLGYSSPDTFNSNKDQLTSLEKRQLIILSKRLTNDYDIKYYTWKLETQKAIYHIMCELLGKVRWEKINPKLVNEYFPFTGEKKQHLSEGYMFSRRYLSLLKKHYNLRVDINKLFNFIMQYSTFFKQYKHSVNHRGWSNLPGYSYSRQYVITTSIKDIYNYILLLNTKYSILYYMYTNSNRFSYITLVYNYIKTFDNARVIKPPDW